MPAHESPSFSVSWGEEEQKGYGYISPWWNEESRWLVLFWGELGVVNCIGSWADLSPVASGGAVLS